VGRLIKEKGVRELLEASRALQEEGVSYQMELAGDGELRDETLAVVQRTGLDDCVTLLGYLEGAPLHQAYRDADVFVLPSYREGFSAAVLEAMATGLPLVLTGVGGMPDCLCQDVNALFVKPGDVFGLANALRRLIQDERLRQTMGLANQEKIKEFSPEKVAVDYLEVLRHLCVPAEGQPGESSPLVRNRKGDRGDSPPGTVAGLPSIAAVSVASGGPVRILMLVPTPGIRSPLSIHTPILISHLRELGCEVAIESWGRHSDNEGFGAKVFGRLWDVRRVRQALRRDRYDVMVVKTAHDWAGAVRDAALLASTGGLAVRRVLQFHGCPDLDRLDKPGSRLFKWLSRYLARASDGILVLSTEEAREWTRFAPNCSCHVVANPFVVPQHLAVAAGSNGTLNGQGRPVILFVGRLIRQKGLLELVDAAAAVLKERPCRLEILGDGPDEGVARDRVQELGIGAHVSFLGFRESDELWRAYKTASVFVLPTWSEGFPTVVAEAMAAGLPIITTQIRGMADHLIEGVNALFVPLRAPTALASAIGKLLGDPDLRARMSAANREKVLDFAPPKVAAQYLCVLRKICDRPSAL
jgi:glycosyltransferase involved in cell wall biosynthesis